MNPVDIFISSFQSSSSVNISLLVSNLQLNESIFSNFLPTQNGTRTLWVKREFENLGKILEKSKRSQFFPSLSAPLYVKGNHP
jgi:hypothetical protein